MAALFDTTVAVLLLRGDRVSRPIGNALGAARARDHREDPVALIRAARNEIAAGAAILPTVAVSELLIGERSSRRSGALASLLEHLPTAILPAEGARHAGLMGSFLRARGGSIPLPDLLIAATAVWLDVPLLTWDGDYSRSSRLARRSRSAHKGAELWRRMILHPASRQEGGA